MVAQYPHNRPPNPVPPHVALRDTGVVPEVLFFPALAVLRLQSATPFRGSHRRTRPVPCCPSDKMFDNTDIKFWA